MLDFVKGPFFTYWDDCVISVTASWGGTWQIKTMKSISHQQLKVEYEIHSEF